MKMRDDLWAAVILAMAGWIAVGSSAGATADPVAGATLDGRTPSVETAGTESPSPEGSRAEGPDTESSDSQGSEAEAPVLVGVLSRLEIETAVPDWIEAQVMAETDAEASMALTAVPPGAAVTVFLGTWCSDSRRELARLWRALDSVGGLVPFELTYVGVDREKAEPRALTDSLDLLYVPTVVVRRDGTEVGRIIEESPAGIEKDLLGFLRGDVTGIVTARTDLGESEGGPAGSEERR